MEKQNHEPTKWYLQGRGWFLMCKYVMKCPLGTGSVLIVLISVFLLYSIIKYEAPQLKTSTQNVNNNSLKVSYDPVAKYGKEKVDAANRVMDLVKQDCNVFIDAGLVVEMRHYINDKNELLGYVNAIANADVILFGSARSIFVYDPSSKLIVSADALRGIRLRD